MVPIVKSWALAPKASAASVMADVMQMRTSFADMIERLSVGTGRWDTSAGKRIIGADELKMGMCEAASCYTRRRTRAQCRHISLAVVPQRRSDIIAPLLR